MLEERKRVAVSVPVPTAFGGKSRPHALTATLAWFTPVVPGRRTYRAVRLKLLEPSEIEKSQSEVSFRPTRIQIKQIEEPSSVAVGQVIALQV